MVAQKAWPFTTVIMNAGVLGFEARFCGLLSPFAA